MLSIFYENKMDDSHLISNQSHYSLFPAITGELL